MENDLPDELIPNGELGLLNSSGNLVPDAASKHKQLSELLRGGSGSSLNPGIGNVNSNSPVQQGVGSQVQGQPNSASIGNLGAMGKSPLNQGDSSASGLAKQVASTSGPTTPASQTLNSQAQKQVGMVTSSPATSQTGPGICMNTNFSQTHQSLLNSNSGHSLMNQPQQGQGQVMNGSLGAAGRGRGAGSKGNNFRYCKMFLFPPNITKTRYLSFPLSFLPYLILITEKKISIEALLFPQAQPCKFLQSVKQTNKQKKQCLFNNIPISFCRSM